MWHIVFVGKLKGKSHFKDLGLDGKILKLSVKENYELVWIHLVQEMDKQWTLVNIVMSLHIP